MTEQSKGNSKNPQVDELVPVRHEIRYGAQYRVVMFYINTKNKQRAFPGIEFDHACYFCNGYAAVMTRGTWAFIDEGGRYVRNWGFADVGDADPDGWTLVKPSCGSNWVRYHIPSGSVRTAKR